MTALLLAESNRLVSRRMTRFFPLILAALMIAGVVIAYIVVSNNNAEVDFVRDIVGAAEANAEERRGGGGGTQVLGPLGFLIPIMTFVIGASFFGADQKAGMIEHLLTWEPRRSRLILARVVGGSVVTFAISALLSAFYVFLMYVFSAIVGSTDGMTSSLWGTVVAALVRSGITGALFFVMGFAITVLTNSATGAIVSFLIYAFVIEGGLLQFFLPKISVWLPMTNATAFADGSDVTRFDDSSGGFGEMVSSHGYITAGFILLAIAAVLTAVSWAVFGRRDID